MKKSQLVNSLYQFLSTNDYINESDQYGEIISSQIIQFLVNEGLLPPPMKRPYFSNGDIVSYQVVNSFEEELNQVPDLRFNNETIGKWEEK
jgi:hypothetical protein